MAVNFIEFTDSRSPGSAGFSMEGGRATLVLDVAHDELTDAVRELLGGCYAVGDGTLARRLPKAHPRWPWLYCERISNIQGLKPDATYTSAEEDLEAPPLEFYQGYSQYRLTCEFTPRPYAVLSDAKVPAYTDSYYDDAGANVAGVTMSQEWLRYTDVITEAKPELITAQHGQMVFYRTDTNSPNEKTFSGFPKILMPDGLVRVRWYQVPESYVRSRSSHLKKWVGRVNQDDWEEWAAGELLYQGFTQRRYPPPVPARVPIPNNSTQFSTAKLVDLELVFLETRRTIGSAYTPGNGNHIAAGHNLQPFLYDRSFYYAAVKHATSASRVPAFLSFAVPLLFTDPDI